MNVYMKRARHTHTHLFEGGMPESAEKSLREKAAVPRGARPIIEVTCAEIEQSAHKRGRGTMHGVTSVDLCAPPQNALRPGLQLIKHGHFG